MKNICLLNDSFPPEIDGVANVVTNYARVLKNEGKGVSVLVPENPDADDSAFDYPVIRYPSLDTRKIAGYTMGLPFARKVIDDVKGENVEILHSHCPISSNYMARGLREALNVPVVMTYHTKFDIDIKNVVSSRILQESAIKLLIDNISASDEVWVVSSGAGENLRSLGYQGDYIVMNNGVDIPRGRFSEEKVRLLTGEVKNDKDIMTFLFVGRMMWYKGIKIILDALAALKSQNYDFRMVFIGGGMDLEEIKAYSRSLKLDEKVKFLGAIYDREVIAAWYSTADLFLFPSTVDTNGLVVREAAACSLPTVMIKGSAASEGVTDRRNGLFIEENAASLAVCLVKYMRQKSFLRKIGERAAGELYISWEDAVKTAMDRYDTVIDNYKSGKYRRNRSLSNIPIKLEGDIIELFGTAKERKKHLQGIIDRYL